MAEISLPAALDALKRRGDPERAEKQRAYHKTKQVHFGTTVPEVDLLVKEWRAEIGDDLAARVTLAGGLWESQIYEARVAAAKLLTQARIKEDGPVWAMITSWVPSFDSWATADLAASAGARRLVAHPERLDEVETWTQGESLWARRAALVFTLPWTKGRHPSADDLARRERVLGWAAGYAEDREWFIQKAIGWWLRELSKRDSERVKAFLADHGPMMKPFAVREASKYL